MVRALFFAFSGPPLREISSCIVRATQHKAELRVGAWQTESSRPPCSGECVTDEAISPSWNAVTSEMLEHDFETARQLENVF